LIALGRVIKFKSSVRSKLGQVDSKSWNRIVDSISNVKIDNSNRIANLKSKIDLKNRFELLKLNISIKKF